MMNCWLKSANSNYPHVFIKDKIKQTIGRSPLTKVKASKLSKAQLEVTANYSKRTVLFKQIGPNNSGINGEAIEIGLEVTAKEGDILNLLLSEDLNYTVRFETEPHPGAANGAKASDSPKPVKKPRMFGKSASDEFRKDVLLPKGNWESINGNDLLIYAVGNNILDSKPNVAAFDIDGTIITTKSGRVFAKDETDWKFLRSSTVSKLQTFFTENPGFKFLLFSNQNGIKDDKGVAAFKKKVEAITKDIGIPALVFIATKKDKFRKPMTGAWDIFVSKFNQHVEPDRAESFYVGDAAGRKKDHSKVDRLFAHNLGLKFYTPEEYFQDVKAQEFDMPVFNPAQVLKEAKENGSNDHIKFPDAQQQEMIIMMGLQGSGKSTFVKQVLLPKAYVQVNCDTLGSIEKCKSVVVKALQDGHKVVIDNTNPSRQDRAKFIELAKKYDVPVRCFKMALTDAQCLHNNKYRFLIGEKAAVPDVAFNTYKSRFSEPSLDEGFSEIVPVTFVPRFSDESREKLYSKYLLEK